jgi:hypothetical protein
MITNFSIDPNCLEQAIKKYKSIMGSMDIGRVHYLNLYLQCYEETYSAMTSLSNYNELITLTKIIKIRDNTVSLLGYLTHFIEDELISIFNYYGITVAKFVINLDATVLLKCLTELKTIFAKPYGRKTMKLQLNYNNLIMDEDFIYHNISLKSGSSYDSYDGKTMTLVNFYKEKSGEVSLGFTRYTKIILPQLEECCKTVGIKLKVRKHV